MAKGHEWETPLERYIMIHQIAAIRVEASKGFTRAPGFLQQGHLDSAS